MEVSVEMTIAERNARKQGSTVPCPDCGRPAPFLDAMLYDGVWYDNHKCKDPDCRMVFTAGQ